MWSPVNDLFVTEVGGGTINGNFITGLHEPVGLAYVPVPSPNLQHGQ